ncbi:MAG TPA: hypothetical protein VHO06_15510 [Polyangia bacterium]|nr:hypothetical protein [Polyangia bacterium]
MMNLSLAQVKKFGSEIQSLKNKHEKALEKADHVIETGVDATLASAAAFGLGVWQTRADHQRLLGVPIDLAVGLAAHAAGFMGMGGKAAPYLHSVGNGALAAHFHTVGRGVGKEMREKAGLPPVAIMGGEGPAEGGSNLSDDALLEMAKRRG